jgi:hypothetical protein
MLSFFSPFSHQGLTSPRESSIQPDQSTAYAQLIKNMIQNLNIDKNAAT